jgi:large subunit ribosomal protein L17
MRHKVFGRKLNRDIKERKALFKSLVIGLITHGKIRTTLAKAKAVLGLVDKLVTRAKDGSESAKTQISSFLARGEAVKKLTNDIAPRFKDRLGGYARIRRTGRRSGDNAEEVEMEWTVPEEKKEVKKTVKGKKVLPQKKEIKEKKGNEKTKV